MVLILNGMKRGYGWITILLETIPVPKIKHLKVYFAQMRPFQKRMREISHGVTIMTVTRDDRCPTVGFHQWTLACRLKIFCACEIQSYTCCRALRVTPGWLTDRAWPHSIFCVCRTLLTIYIINYWCFWDVPCSCTDLHYFARLWISIGRLPVTFTKPALLPDGMHL